MDRPPEAVARNPVSVHRRRPHPLSFYALLLLLFGAPAPNAGVVDFSPALMRSVADRWGQDANQRLLEWQQIVKELRSPAPTQSARTEQNWARSANNFWNHVPYADDYSHWGIEDYWATPIETLASNAGDCEDYAIGKYFTLKALGVPIQKLRITYVRALNWNQPHMVLAYYPEPDADPLILDNLNKDVVPASRRTDLEPIYSFNDEDLWTPLAPARVGKSSQIRLWREVLRKMENEQRM